MRKYIFIVLLLSTSLLQTQTTDYVRLQLDQVRINIEEKNYAQGMSILNELLQQNPNDSNIYRYYAELLLNLGHNNLALSNIQKAILLSQDTPSNHLIAGNIYRAQSNYTQAQQSYNKTIQLAPGMGEAYTEFTLLNLQHYYMSDARRLSELAYRFNPESWQNVILRARISQQTGNNTLAQQLFLQGIKDFPYNEQLLDAFAQFYLSINEPSKAIIILKEANSRFGESISRNLLLADSAFIQNLQTEAIRYYETINNTYTQLKLPLSPLIQWRLYNLYRLNNNIEQSYSFLQKALELDPNNQLYISTFYQYVMSTDNDSLKISLSKHLENIAIQNRTLGINDYYLSLLQKIISLNPANNRIRQLLLNYAQIQKKENLIQQILEQSLVYEPNNAALQRSIALRQRLQQTRQLDTNMSEIYQYTNKIFVEDNICYFSKSVQQEIQNIQTFYPKIASIVELQQNFAQESRTMFQTNTNYNIISHLYIDRLGQTIYVEIFDKVGVPLTTFKQGFQTENITQILISMTRFLDDLLPSIGYITDRQINSQFTINIGTNHDIQTNSILAILDKDFNPLTTAEIITISDQSATIRQLQTPLQAIQPKISYVLPIQFVPSLNTNTNSTSSIIPSMISNINQISQTRYPLQINLSPTQ